MSGQSIPGCVYNHHMETSRTHRPATTEERDLMVEFVKIGRECRGDNPVMAAVRQEWATRFDAFWNDLAADGVDMDAELDAIEDELDAA